MLIPVSDNLALLGNINSVETENDRKDYNNFLSYISSNWKNIFLIPGPYEYTSKKPTPFYDLYTELTGIKHKYENIKILNNSNWHLPNTNITLVGSTLWTAYPYYRMPCCYEFSYIYKHSKEGLLRQMLGDDLKEWYYEDITHIKESIKTNDNIIILSHHLPTPYLTSSNIKKRMEASNLENMFKKSIPIWLGGAGNKTVSGSFGITTDTFCGVNTYTTFDRPHVINSGYDPKVYVSLRTNTIY